MGSTLKIFKMGFKSYYLLHKVFTHYTDKIIVTGP